jgi:predicted nucleic acid-binding protein
LSRRAFFDTNVPLYLLSDDASKSRRAETLLSSGGTISVQVLNEFVAAARRKRLGDWDEIDELLWALQRLCEVHPVSLEAHELGVKLARRYDLHIYDACIVASAKLAGCTTLYTEDLHHGQRIDGLTIRNPFLA